MGKPAPGYDLKVSEDVLVLCVMSCNYALPEQNLNVEEFNVEILFSESEVNIVE